jgi:indole-3-glycerol phosphate synthase
MFLEKIIEVKQQELQKRKTPSRLKAIKERIPCLPSPRDLRDSISEHGPMALIAEIKRASPSVGVIRENMDRRLIARQYEAGGACAVSVLTEPHFFKGHLSFLHEVRKVTSLPILQKDFIIDPFQIYEARALGADAILLIASLLERKRLKEFMGLALNLHMVPLVEVHDEKDLEKALLFDPPLIGINNRDLKTFEVDLGTTLRLRKQIPARAKVISESGIKTLHDVRVLREAKVDAILVGEILVRSSNPASKIKELLEI